MINLDATLESLDQNPSFCDGRVYVHRLCQGETKISGDDHRNLANPFAAVSETICVVCSRGVDLDEVQWTDTSEQVSHYRRRLSSQFTFMQKLVWHLCSSLVTACFGACVILLVIWLREDLIPGSRVAAVLLFGLGFGLVFGRAFGSPVLANWILRADFRKYV